MITADLPVNDIWVAGDTHQIEILLTEEGQPLPLTGYAITFTAKQSKDDADNALTTIQKTLGSGIDMIDEANGNFVITIDPADTKDLETDTTYYWDIQISQGGEVLTVALGTMKFIVDITQKLV